MPLKVVEAPPNVQSGRGRWRGRPLLSLALRGAALALPIAVSVVTGVLVSRVLPAGSGAGRLGWLMVVLGASLLALVVVDRLARRLLPIAALLRLTLVFPDRAPSRFRVAMRATSVKRLREWAEAASASARDGDDPKARAQQVLALAAALNAHDRRTRGHSERVRALTELVAEEMRLPATDAQRLQWAALLHDIGKITVPARILNKPGRPDAREWRVLQRHPAAGGRIARPLRPWLGDWVDAVTQHHERFDGNGYPHGLAGHDISLAARIVSVTDAYETMTAVRAYKKPMSAGDAREELARCAGTHFDPRVVRAFLKVSLGRLRLTAGLAASVAQIPVLGLLPRAGARVRMAAGQSAASAVTTAGAVALAAAVAQLGGTGAEPRTPAPLSGPDTSSRPRSTTAGEAGPSAGLPAPGPDEPGGDGAGAEPIETPELGAPPVAPGPAVDNAAVTVRAQVGETEIEVAVPPAVAVERGRDFDTEIDAEAGDIVISLP
ncbi:MAG: HD-GYP domain-containing protein [Actinomycetota bacterium]